VSKLPTHNRFYRVIWAADSFVSTALFELWDGLKRAGSAYSSWLYRWFRLSGLKRILIDLVDDAFTFAVVAAFGLLAFALPPFSGTGDIWNRGREYAITFTVSDGKLIGRRGISQNDSIPLDEIPPVLIKAVLATEDARFYDHFGVDVIGTLRALLHNTRGGGSKQGGSSITQQVVKNLLLTPERTIRRKVNEAFLSLWVEERLTKSEILKLYLDRSYLGGGNTGVEAASQFYFGKSVRDIGLPEAAVLAGLFKAPTQYAPHANPEASRARSNVVLYRMLDAGFVTQGELLQAQRQPAEIVKQNILASPNWFLDFAYQDTLEVIARQNLKNDYVIEVKTSINSKLQEASQAIINDMIDHEGPTFKYSQAASVTMAPDGAVREIVGGRDYEESQFNRATSGKRQVGSAFKPFVYMAALNHGYTPSSVVVDGPVCVINWCVHNFEPGYRGATTLTNALTHSINTIAVKLMLEVGRKTVEQTARDVGITGQIDKYPTMAIGTSSLTLIDLATGYATFANNGKLAKPYAVVEIRNPNGDLLYSRASNESDAPQVERPEKIAELVSMMRNVVVQGTGTRAELGYAPVAGKTGTNSNFRDGWFMGFSAHNVTGVWAGNDDNTPMNDSKEHAATGGHVAAPSWKRIMDVAEFRLKPAGLPGMPLDPKAPPPLTAINDPVVIAVAAGFAGDTMMGPPVPASLTAPAAPSQDDEAQASLAATGTPDQADAQSTDVLNNMIDLFQNASSNDAGSAAATGQAFPPHATHKRSAFARRAPAPAPPKHRSFFDILFGRH
jgi:penicillin-binding protein 1A